MQPEVDLVLEGGGLKLERALLEYRALKQLLARDWKRDARTLEKLATHIAQTELDVQRLEARARHRSSIDVAFSEGAKLANKVTAARDALCAQLKTTPDQLCVAMDTLMLEADDAIALGRAHEQFAVEQRVVTFGSGFALVLPILFSYLTVMNDGGVRFAPSGVISSWFAGFGLFLACAAALGAQFRLEAWSWLGTRRAWQPGNWLLIAVMLTAALPWPWHPSNRDGAIAFTAMAALLIKNVVDWARAKPSGDLLGSRS